MTMRIFSTISQRLKLKGETQNVGVRTKERKGVTAEVLMATPCTNSLGGESASMKDVGGAGFGGSSPPFVGRERAAVDVEVGPERRCPAGL